LVLVGICEKKDEERKGLKGKERNSNHGSFRPGSVFFGVCLCCGVKCVQMEMEMEMELVFIGYFDGYFGIVNVFWFWKVPMLCCVVVFCTARLWELSKLMQSLVMKRK